jgi:CBS domain-containing protein
MTMTAPSTDAATAFPTLRRLKVIDALHPGLISCPPETPLRTVARMMATYRVHAILVVAHGDEPLPSGRRWGIISDGDLIRAGAEEGFDERPAETLATEPVPTVATHDVLAAAAARMLEADVSHLVAVEPHSGKPVGVLSTLDLARALAGFPERTHPL